LPREEAKVEKWYKKARSKFTVECARCHARQSDVDVGYASQHVLTSENIKRDGYENPKKLRAILRYGNEEKKKKMPGYGADCADVSDRAYCQNVEPIEEEMLRDIEDFIYNRANQGWVGPP